MSESPGMGDINVAHAGAKIINLLLAYLERCPASGWHQARPSTAKSEG
jgi:hypothetical protein